MCLWHHPTKPVLKFPNNSNRGVHARDGPSRYLTSQYFKERNIEPQTINSNPVLEEHAEYECFFTMEEKEADCSAWVCL